MFSGLAIENLETEWKKHPVLLISFAGTKFTDMETLQIYLDNIFLEFEKEYQIQNPAKNEWGSRFRNILKSAYEKTGADPVVLIDEYDAPLLDSMDNGDLQASLKQEMRKFFSPLKDSGEFLRFVFLTGISKFSQLSIFSELNNLKVITMDDDYAAVCGITEEELFSQMQPEIQALADKNHLSYEEDGDAETALTLMKAFLSSIPYNAEKQDENHYKTLFYLIARLCKIGANFDSTTRTLGEWKVAAS